jgi:lipid-binding SYLF domain-containing protein
MPIHRRLLALASLALIAGCSSPSNLAYQSVQDARVLDEFRLARRIDDSTFRGGRGGFVVGLTAGHGVAVRRLGDHWSPPLPLDIVAGSLGLQIGGEGGRLVMIFSSTEAFENFVFEGSQFLAEASGTAWNAKGAAGDPLDPSQVQVISEVGGLYGGAVIGGFGVSVDRSMMKRAYGESASPRAILEDRDVVTPAGAATLWKSLGR